MFYVCFLAFPSLNRWCTHTERARVLCPSTLVWFSLQVTRGNQEDNMHILVQLCTKYTRVGDTHVSS